MTERLMEVSAERLLAAARGVMAQVIDCWVATQSAEGGVDVRVMVPIAGLQDAADWTIWLMTSAGSRKAAEIRRCGRLTVGYQHHPDRAYVALMGSAEIVADRAFIRGHWREPWRTYFPGGAEDPDFVFVRLVTDRIELCVPGATPEPFGIRHSALARAADGGWQVIDG